VVETDYIFTLYVFQAKFWYLEFYISSWYQPTLSSTACNSCWLLLHTQLHMHFELS